VRSIVGATCANISNTVGSCSVEKPMPLSCTSSVLDCGMVGRGQRIKLHKSPNERKGLARPELVGSAVHPEHGVDDACDTQAGFALRLEQIVRKASRAGPE